MKKKIIKLDKIDFVLIGIITILLALMGFCIGWYTSTIENTSGKILLEIKDNLDCTNLSLIKTSYCLNNKVRKFYIYNLSNNDKLLSDEKLIKKGGTCLEWTKYYLTNLQNRGFLGKKVSFYNKDYTEGHAIALVWDKNAENYCIIDQQKVIGCGNLKGDTNEN